jgi:predicted MFS family arabinose efflux permease
MDVLRGLIMLAVGALAFADRLSVPAVLIAAVLSSGCMVFFDPAVSTVLLDIIPHDDMVRGQSVQNGVRTLLSLVGKAFSGALIVAAGVPLVIVLNGISYLISALTEVFISVPNTQNQGAPVTVKSVLRDFRVALDETFRNKYLRLFIPPVLILNIFASGPFALMLPFATEKGFSVEQYGYLMSIVTAASLICVVLLGIVKLGSKTRYRLMVTGYLLFIGFSVAAYLSAGFWPVAVLAFLALFANTLANSIFNAALMLALPEGKRGALLGMIAAASSGGNALSAVIYGILCDAFPIHLVFAAGSLLSLPPLIYLCFHKDTKEFITTH